MKTTFKFFAAALAIVAAVSCAKEGNNGRDESPLELVPVSFSATIDSPSDPSSPDKRTTLADDGLSVHWTEGDKVLLYVPGEGYYWGTSRVALTANYVSESLAGFDGSAPSADSYNAVYPYDAAYIGQYSNQYYFFVANTLASQTVRPNDFSTTTWGVSNIALATGIVSGEKVNFSNVLSHFKFSIANEGVRSISISTSKAYDLLLSGNQSSYVGLGGQLAIRKSDGKFFIYSNAGITVTNNGADFAVGETYYVAFPPFDMTDLTFSFKDADGNEMGSLTRSSFSPLANTIYDLGVIELPKKYAATSDPISTATTLTNGKTYAIKHSGTGYYWTVQGGALTLTAHETGDPFTEEMIFMYYNNSGAGKYPSGYNSNMVGTFRAVGYNNYYLNTSFEFTSYSSGNILYLAFCNGWLDNGTPESGSDIDVYKVNSSTDLSTGDSYPLYWTGTELSVDTKGLGMGNASRKWYIYEVSEL